jgi:hypothetical protein
MGEALFETTTPPSKKNDFTRLNNSSLTQDIGTNSLPESERED